MSTRERWIESIWRRLIAEGTGGEVKEPPPWFDYPAVCRTTISSPAFLGPFQEGDKDKPYADQVKPFNFLLSPTVDGADGFPEGRNPKRFHLVGPYERNPTRWARLAWFDVYSRRRVKVCTNVQRSAENLKAARVRTYRDVYRSYAAHPEPKSADQDGNPCGRSTVGLLARRPVEPLARIYVGKESNKMDDVHAGRVHDWSEVRSTYHFDGGALPDRVRALLKSRPAAELAEQLGISKGYVKALRNGHKQPSAKLMEKILWELR